jgi:hypothetical protein
MKTLLITGKGAPVPGALRDVIARGSTSLAERRADEVAAAAPATHLDRVVFWAAEADPSLRELASRYARLERAERQEIVVYVTTMADDSVPDLSPDEVYVWPQDEDRLMMAFMTGA